VRDERRLARRAARGDRDAFTAIFRRFQQDLYRYCAAILGNSEDAQDALQNTMVKALGALPGERREIDLKPWLYRIAHNESIDLIRRRRQTVPLEDDGLPAGAGLAEQVEMRHRLRQLLADVGELPERQRGALLMREAGGLEFEEIAAALGTTPGVARQTVYEARLGLREMDAGRNMECTAVTKALSDGDGRIRRRRDLTAHLKACPECRLFAEEIDSRRRALASISPLPALAAAALLQGLAGGGGSSGAVVSSGATAAPGTSAGAGVGGAVAGKAIGTGDPAQRRRDHRRRRRDRGRRRRCRWLPWRTRARRPGEGKGERRLEASGRTAARCHWGRFRRARVRRTSSSRPDLLRQVEAGSSRQRPQACGRSADPLLGHRVRSDLGAGRPFSGRPDAPLGRRRGNGSLVRTGELARARSLGGRTCPRPRPPQAAAHDCRAWAGNGRGQQGKGQREVGIRPGSLRQERRRAKRGGRKPPDASRPSGQAIASRTCRTFTPACHRPGRTGIGAAQRSRNGRRRTPGRLTGGTQR
jgi:RNA polymerase sigma factor (sigma-70 family)